MVTGDGNFSGLRSGWFYDRRRRRTSLLLKETQSQVGSATASTLFKDYFFGGGPQVKPTTVLNTADLTSFGTDTTPTLEMTATDGNGHDVRYNIEIDPTATFDSSVSLVNADSYSETNQSATFQIFGTTDGAGQSFLGNGGTLSKAKFYIRWTGAQSTETLNAKIFAHTGTYGTSSAPTGAALATSDNFDSSSLTSSFQLIELNFSGANKISLTNGTPYVVRIDSATVPANGFDVGVDSTSPSHSGNSVQGTSGFSSFDTCFYVQTETVAPLLDKVSGTDAGFVNTVSGGDTDPFNSGEKVSFTVQAGDALSGGTYYWRARAIDPNGGNQYGAWATTRSFTVTTGTPSSTTQDVRTTGASTSSVDKDVRTTGSSTSNTNRDTRVTGASTSNTTADVRITGLSSSSPISTLSDNFNDNSFNTSLWVTDVSGTTVTEQNNRLELTHPSSPSGAFADVLSVASYTLVDSSAVIEIVDVPTGSIASSAFGVVTAGFANSVTFDINNGTLAAKDDDNSDVSTSFSLTNHRFLRIRIVGTAVYWDTSADGATWSNLKTVASLSYSLDTVQAYIGTNASSGSSPGSFIVDNFNIYRTFTAHDVRVTGSSVSSDAHDVRATGTAISSQAQDVRATGTATSSTAQDVRTTGWQTSNDTRDARVTGTAASQSTQDVRATGTATSNTSQDVRAQGTATSSDSRDVRTTGTANSSDSRDTRITGSLGSIQSQDTRITGTATSADTRDARVTGTSTSSDTRDVRTTGANASSDTRDARITGTSTSSDTRDTRVTGQNTSADTRDTRITGTSTSSDDRDARVTGRDTSSDTKDTRVVGQDTQSDTRDVRVTGQSSASSSSTTQDVRTTGQETSSQSADARTTGQQTSSQANDARTTGADTSSKDQDSRITGQATSSTTQDVRVFGAGSDSVTIDLRVTGADSSFSSRDVRIDGGISSSDTREIRLIGVDSSESSFDVMIIGGFPAWGGGGTDAVVITPGDGTTSGTVSPGDSTSVVLVPGGTVDGVSINTGDGTASIVWLPGDSV